MQVCSQRNQPGASSGHTHKDYTDDRHNDDTHRNGVLRNKPVDDNKEVLYDSILVDGNQNHDAEALVVAGAEPVDEALAASLAKVVVWAVADVAAATVSVVAVRGAVVVEQDAAVVEQDAAAAVVTQKGFARSPTGRTTS
jgi:hypothetical protein